MSSTPECQNYSQKNGCLKPDKTLCSHVNLPVEDGTARFRIPLVFCDLTGEELSDNNVGSIPEILAKNADIFESGGGGCGGIGPMFHPKEKG